MRETVLLLDETAEAAIAGAATYLQGQGLRLTVRTPYSVAFAAPEGATPGVGQLAAVPVQRRPAWCRVWVTVEGEGPAGAAADAYVAGQQARSARVGAIVQALEREIYDEAQWPAHEATLRATLGRQGMATATIEARVAAFKKRWQALGRKARAGAEVPPPPDPRAGAHEGDLSPAQRAKEID
jgi:hypothetical protein